jgi:hypothetical protein
MLVNASTSPLLGSSTTDAPLKPDTLNASSTAFCTSASIVSCRRLPSFGGFSSSTRISRPTLLTTTRLAPSSPISRLL